MASDWLDKLEHADRMLRVRVARPRSLAPSREEATPLRDLVPRLLSQENRGTAAWRDALTEGMTSILGSLVEHFPETLFWDLDALGAALLGGAPSPSRLGARCRAIVAVQAAYGRHTVLRFRYVHDFTYGFDWAKWVGRCPQERSLCGPFDEPFIDYLAQRGQELVALVAADDTTYPKLPDGRPRNPFAFAREPDDEARLLEDLASRGQLPVAAWETAPRPRWDAPFARWREERARALGIQPNTPDAPPSSP